MLTLKQIFDEDGEVDGVFNPEVPKPVSKMIDRFGNRFVFVNAGDIWLPPIAIGKDNTWQRLLKEIKELFIRDDDIIICSYPKTGLHWTIEMVNMLVKNNTDYLGDAPFFGSWLEMKSSRRTNIATDEGTDGKPRILHTHLPFRHLPKQVLEKKVKVICLIRNPKDTMVSYYCQTNSFRAPYDYPGTFEQFVLLNLECGFQYGNVFEYLMGFQDGWDEHPDVPVLTCIYEDMKRNPVKAVQRINTFLDTNRDDAFCQQVSDACAFKQMKKHKESDEHFVRSVLFRENAVGFYRKGVIGDWKNMFTVELNDAFDEQCKNRMEGYRTEFQYE